MMRSAYKLSNGTAILSRMMSSRSNTNSKRVTGTTDFFDMLTRVGLILASFAALYDLELEYNI